MNKKKLQDFTNFIKENYTVAQLKNLYSRVNIVKPNNKNINSELVDWLSLTTIKPTNNSKKNEFVEWFLEVLLNKDSFLQLFETFTENEKKVLFDILYENKKIYYDEITLPNNIYFYQYYNFYQNIHKKTKYEYSFFTANNYYFSLPDEIKEIIIKYFKMPEKYLLKNIKNPDTTKYTFSNEKFILKNIKSYIKFLEYSSLQTQDNIKKNLPKKSIKDFLNFCDYEFINESIDKEKEIKLFIKFLQLFTNDKVITNLNEMKPQDIVKGILSVFFIGNIFDVGNILEDKVILDYLSFSQNYSFDGMRYYRITVKEILELISDNNWVEYENLIISLPVNKIKIGPGDINDSIYKYYWNIKSSFFKSYLFDIKNHKFQYADIPILSSYLMLLTIMGCIEAKYDDPYNQSNKELQREYFTIFDNLKYIRLTDLGKYVIGELKTYEYNEENEDNNFEISLSPDILIATTDINNALAKIVLREFGEQMGENSFKFNYQYFFRNSKNLQEVNDKYNRLMNLLSQQKIPNNWKSFLSNLKKRIMKFKLKEEMYILDLPKNIDFIKFLTSDKSIKKLILKVENNKFAIHKKHLGEFKRIVAKNGFWLDLYMQPTYVY